MPQLDIDDEITTAGDSAADEPAIGDLRRIIHHTGITLATYRVTAVWPPVVEGALWRLNGRIISTGEDNPL